jgi:hypothetical protein
LAAVIGLAVALCGGALWQRQSHAAEQSETAARAQRDQSARMLAVRLAHRPATSDAAPAPLAAGVPAPSRDAAPTLSDNFLAHARSMLSLNVLNAVESGDANDAQWVRNQLDDPRLKGSVSLGDLETLELAIDCLAHQSDARDEARDLLEFAEPSMLSDALRWACE